MAQDSKIEWTNHTVNLWWGCTKVHAGCDNCYAEYLSDVRYKNNLWGNGSFRKAIKSSFSNLDKFQKLAAEKNEFHKVFIGSMMDIFEKPMPLIDGKGNVVEIKSTYGNESMNTQHLRALLFDLISRNKFDNLIFLFLTKRPSNINKYIPESWKENPPKNVWFGTSISTQETANTLIPQLLKVNGNRFLSIEPQLEHINITDYLMSNELHWVIQGGESGHNKRPFNNHWAYSLKDDCTMNKVPYFFKQIDKIQEIPFDLQVRQFPKF